MKAHPWTLSLAAIASLTWGLFLPTETWPAAAQGPGTTERVSVASDGTEGNDDSWEASISADGRYVAFESWADNLVPGDTNDEPDVFVHDRQTGQTARVSVASDGTEGNDDSGPASISADGRYVAFGSWADNLVPGDTNGWGDVFVRDRQTGQTARVSVASDGTEFDYYSVDASISAGGRYVAFGSRVGQPGPLVAGDVFVHDRQTGQTACVLVASDSTEGNGGSEHPSISADGRYVAFESEATNLVSGDTNEAVDVFVHDRQTGQTARVSVASDGTELNYQSVDASISADGRYVAFGSLVTPSYLPDLGYDVFVHDRQTGQTARVSVAPDGTQWDGCYGASISADGRYVAFGSLVLLGVGNRHFIFPVDVFVHDRQTGKTARVSVASDGTEGNNSSWSRCISADGRYVAFDSGADNLVPGDTNGWCDVFVHNRQPASKLYLPVIRRKKH